MRILFGLVFAVVGCSSSERLQNAIVVTPLTESFAQTSSSQPLDLLFVVDNSQSMAPVQQKVADNTQVLFNWLDRSGVDYHVAVTSTDLLGQRGRKLAAQGHFSTLGGTAIIQKSTPNAAAVFAQNVQLGNDGSNTETPIAAAMTALGLVKAQAGVVPAGNEGFLRAVARLAVVFIGDEDDHSQISSAEFLLALRNLKGHGNESQVYLGAVLWDDLTQVNKSYVALHEERFPPGTCKKAPSDQSTGFTLIAVIADSLFPGYVASICGDFSQTLRKLGLDASGLKNSYALSGKPDTTVRVFCPDKDHPRALCVTVNKVVVSSAIYDSASNSIVFPDADVPPFGATIAVSYGIQTSGRKAGAPDESICGSDDNCPRGVRCQAGTCHLTCTSDAVCSAGYSCVDKSCRCAGDKSCSASETCSLSGVCQPRLGCQTNGDCTPGQACVLASGTCEAAATCATLRAELTSADLLNGLSCNKGETCRNGACIADCQGDCDCPTGQTCIADANGGPNVCAKGCYTDAQCCIHQTCDLATHRCAEATAKAGSLPYCDHGSCLTGAPNACSAGGGECAFIYDANSSGCLPTCTLDAECGAGSYCGLTFELATACTYGGHECSSGHTCSATAETPDGSCSCVSNADCDAVSECVAVAGGLYCLNKQRNCAPRYDCVELVPSFDTACWDLY